MKTLLQQLAIAVLACMALSTANAEPLILPDPAANSVATGEFQVNEQNQVTLIGTPISFSTTLPIKVDAASGTSTFKSGSIHYDDGTSNIDGQMSKVTLGRYLENGQVTYMLKGLIFGKLIRGGDHIDVKGNFSVSTLPAPEGTLLADSQVDKSDIILTVRIKSTKTTKN
ncbi:MAG: hypothetical protein HOP23_10145 [Methylococcaceae bacterium]|nr:hypothetical protein [Methylococcaceae bacterium]